MQRENKILVDEEQPDQIIPSDTFTASGLPVKKTNWSMSFSEFKSVCDLKPFCSLIIYYNFIVR